MEKRFRRPFGSLKTLYALAVLYGIGIGFVIATMIWRLYHRTIVNQELLVPCRMLNCETGGSGFFCMLVLITAPVLLLKELPSKLIADTARSLGFKKRYSARAGLLTEVAIGAVLPFCLIMEMLFLPLAWSKLILKISATIAAIVVVLALYVYAEAELWHQEVREVKG